MKLRALFVLLAAYLSPLIILANDIDVESAITEVSLFRDGALVTREGTFNAPAGKSILVFKNLPAQVDSSALRANFIETANGLIRNAKIFRPEESEESDSIKSIRDRLDAAKKDKERQLRIYSEAKADIEFASDMRESFAAEFGKIDEGESLSLEQAKELNAFVRRTQADAYQTIDQSENAMRDIDDRIKEIETELREAVEKAALLSSIAEVEIEMDSAGEVGIALSYLANNARWAAQYELRASPDQGSLDFGYFASVWQHTGENWSDITLSLQTNQASRQGNVPEPPPLVVRKIEDYYRGRAASQEEALELSPFSVDAASAKSARLGPSARFSLLGTYTQCVSIPRLANHSHKSCNTTLASSRGDQPRMAIFNAARAGGFTGATAETEIDMANRDIVDWQASILYSAHQIDATAGRIVFIARLKISRTR